VLVFINILSMSFFRRKHFEVSNFDSALPSISADLCFLIQVFFYTHFSFVLFYLFAWWHSPEVPFASCCSHPENERTRCALFDADGSVRAGCRVRLGPRSM
jgi:hypothetical protein